MKKFDWKLASIEEMATQIIQGNEGSNKQLFAYYKRNDNKVMIDKIVKARKLVKMWDLEDQLQVLKLEMEMIDD